MQLLHMVCFKYKADVAEPARADHRAKLQGLRGLPGILDLKVGADVVGSARSYDTGLLVTFGDRAALDAYQKDPAHVGIAQHGASLSQHVVAVDFEI